ncbi:MAG: formate dehydrogenase accessory protein FdhE [Enterobacteriaceae bacterium]
MSIRVVNDSEAKTTAAMIPPLLLPKLNLLYARRSERLQQLAQEHPLGDYLHFSAALVAAQQQMLQTHPLPEQERPTVPDSLIPLDCRQWSCTAYWQQLLEGIIAYLQPHAPQGVQPVLQRLLEASPQQRQQMANQLLQGDYQPVGSDKALFIWAALSLYWAQMAACLPGRGQVELGEGRQFCPVCHSMPVSSMVQIGASEGLRYLHCSLCESEWHMVRVKCTNCEQGGNLEYWSLESEKAAVKAEACSDCHSYLKILYQPVDPKVDAVADDLASLILDDKLEQQGFSRSAINPLLFPG